MLKEAGIKAAAAREARYMIADLDGLYLEVFPTGRKVFLLRTTVGIRRRKFVLGEWPDMSLRDARIACGKKKDELETLSGTASYTARTFGALAHDWKAVALEGCTSKYKSRMDSLINARVLPKFENRLAASITSLEVLSRIREIEAEDKLEVSHRVLGIFNHIFAFGVSTSILDNNPAASLGDSIKPRHVVHYARLEDPRDVGQLMRAIDGYSRPRVRNALFFSAFVFCRPGEIRRAEWREFDFNSLLWRIPAEKMKMRETHLVPLSKQVVEVLKEQRALLLEYYPTLPAFVFPSERTASRPMSADTVRCALRSMGYGQDEMTAHGFRSIASTILNESGIWSPDSIERQLSHAPKDQTRESYNYAQWLPERTRMMQWYADELERLRDLKAGDGGSEVGMINLDDK